jgi:exopolysaccharide biosynthesis polyprenyl glycosylphosphotransferase
MRQLPFHPSSVLSPSPDGGEVGACADAGSSPAGSGSARVAPLQASRRSVLILGTGPRALALASVLERAGDVRVHAFLDDEPQRDERERLPARYRGSLGEFSRLATECPIEQVFYALPRRFLSSESVEHLVADCATLGIDITFPLDLFGAHRSHVVIDHRGPFPSVRFSGIPHARWQLAIKRAIDVVGALLGLLVTAPIWLVAMAAIALDSGWPVLFSQTRVGRFGKPFRFLKLRTMVRNAEAVKAQLLAHNEQSGPVFKMQNDPRVTRVGRFLRRYSIDELPQLVNVLRGEMSLVGPRPPLPEEVAQYEFVHRARLGMRPGLTCTWQVSGRSEIPFTDWVKLDVQYIESWSLWLDLQLALRTIPAVLFGRGAS